MSTELSPAAASSSSTVALLPRPAPQIAQVADPVPASKPAATTIAPASTQQADQQIIAGAGQVNAALSRIDKEMAKNRPDIPRSQLDSYVPCEENPFHSSKEYLDAVPDANGIRSGHGWASGPAMKLLGLGDEGYLGMTLAQQDVWKTERDERIAQGQIELAAQQAAGTAGVLISCARGWEGTIVREGEKAPSDKYGPEGPDSPPVSTARASALYSSSNAPAWDFTVKEGKFEVQSKTTASMYGDKQVNCLSTEQVQYVQDKLNNNQALKQAINVLFEGLRGETAASDYKKPQTENKVAQNSDATLFIRKLLADSFKQIEGGEWVDGKPRQSGSREQAQAYKDHVLKQVPNSYSPIDTLA
jgi:hypothetical protein